jgi:energy-coupling factor transporter transmembrane protein EcfT
LKTHFHNLWGSAAGTVKILSPATRIICGVCVFLAAMTAPADSAAGVAIMAFSVIAWTAVCRPPWRILWGSLALGAVMFLPYFLLTPFIRYGGAAVPAGILLRGLCGLLISASTVTSLDLSELREGVLRLPLPSMVKDILLQIVQQTGTLMYETGRMSSAMAVRGATGRGVAAWRLLSNLPKVWLPRIVLRAERLADAMELRGYGDSAGVGVITGWIKTADAVSMVLAVTLLLGAIAARWWK